MIIHFNFLLQLFKFGLTLLIFFLRLFLEAVDVVIDIIFVEFCLFWTICTYKFKHEKGHH